MHRTLVNAVADVAILGFPQRDHEMGLGDVQYSLVGVLEPYLESGPHFQCVITHQHIVLGLQNHRQPTVKFNMQHPIDEV